MADHAQDDDHSTGTADIRAHERTFERFVRMVAWGIGISVGILIFLALANS